MKRERATRISKFLSLVLRHKPEEIGIQLGTGGWVEVEELLAACAEFGLAFTKEELDNLIASSDKKRFGFSTDGKFIRAHYGHSVPVELGYEPAQPPDILYHGTAVDNLDSVLGTGLSPGRRRMVHLSTNVETALKVGQRHGKPVVLQVDAWQMDGDGIVFLRTPGDVWLTEHVPARYLSLLNNA